MGLGRGTWIYTNWLTPLNLHVLAAAPQHPSLNWSIRKMEYVFPSEKSHQIKIKTLSCQKLFQYSMPFTFVYRTADTYLRAI